MRRTTFGAAALAVAVVLGGGAAGAGVVPQRINFQAQLTDNLGTPVGDVTANLTFRMYFQNPGGAEQWTEVHAGVSVVDSLFSVQLGAFSPFSTAVPPLTFDRDYWLSVEVNTDGEMSPRFRLAAAPYAIMAADSQALGGALPAAYALAADLSDIGGTINTPANPLDWSQLKSVPGDFADGTDDGNTYTAGTGLTLVGLQFAADAGTAAGQVAAGDHDHTHAGDVTGDVGATTVSAIQTQTVDVLTTPPTNGQILKWNGTQWEPADDAGGAGSGQVDSVGAGAGISVSVDPVDPVVGVVFGTALGEVAQGNHDHTLAGDVTGASGTTTVAALQGRAVDSTIAPTDGQALKWNNTLSRWEPQDDGGGGGQVDTIIAGNGIAVAGTAVDPTVSALVHIGGAIENNHGALGNELSLRDGDGDGRILKWHFASQTWVLGDDNAGGGSVGTLQEVVDTGGIVSRIDNGVATVSVTNAGSGDGTTAIIASTTGGSGLLNAIVANTASSGGYAVRATATNNIGLYAEGDVTAAEFNGNVNVTGDVDATGAVSAGTTITAGGDISSTTGSVNAAADVAAGGALSAGTTITAGGDISGVNVSASGDMAASGVLQTGGATPAAYNRVGVGTTSHAAAVTGNKDLHIEEDLEVDGSVYADGPAVFGGSVRMPNFQDSDDVNYIVNPDGLSVLSSIRVDAAIGGTSETVVTQNGLDVLDTAGDTAFAIQNSGAGNNVNVSIDGDLTVAGAISGDGAAVTNINADNVATGELHTDRYSAYDDLTAEGILLNDGGTDLLTRDQADARYANEAQVDSVTSAMILDDEIVDADIAAGANISASKINRTGLDADTLDGYDSAEFFALAESETVTGRPSFNGGVTGTTPPFWVSSAFRVPNLNADLLDGEHGVFYQNADNIIAGTLDNLLFSAYSDLGDELKLDNDDGADLLTQAQADGRFVNEAQAGSVTSAMIVDGTVSTGDILDGTVALADLNLPDVDSRYVEVAGDTMAGTLTVNPGAADTYGVNVNNGATLATAAYGAFGRANGAGGGDRIGVRGLAASTGGTSYGLYGSASGTGTNYGVYSDGDMHATGDLTVDGIIYGDGSGVGNLDWSNISNVPAEIADGDDVDDADNDPANEYNTGFTWDDAGDILTIVDVGASRFVSLDNEADDLGDNSINDLSDVAVTTPAAGEILVLDAANTWVNQAPPTTLPPSGAAGGDLFGSTYPDPQVVDDSHNHALATGATDVTATAAEVNVLAGSTAGTADLNKLAAVTADAGELNVLDGSTASTADLNKLAAVTSTAAELNVLDGITASTANLNLLTGASGTVWTSANHGADTGLDADLLDGLDSLAFLRSDADDSYAGTTLTIGGSSTLDIDGTLQIDGGMTKAGTGMVANLNADLLDTQHGAFYQNADNINAGTLNAALYSAYSDLGAEGILDNNAVGDLLTQTQLDGRFVNVTDTAGGGDVSGTFSALVVADDSHTHGSGTITEVDPQVGTISTSYVPRWDGSALVTGRIRDNGTNVAIGTAPNAVDKLVVYRPSGEVGPGRSSIYASRMGDVGGAGGGSSWSLSGVDTAIRAYNSWGNVYSCGIYTYSWLDNGETAALVADSDFGGEAKLCYLDGGGSGWAGHFTGNVNVTGGVTASSYSYPAAQTRYFGISSSSFTPDLSSTAYTRDVLRLRNTGASTATFTAPVNLPLGATITGMYVRIYDSTSTASITATLRYKPVTLQSNHVDLCSDSTTAAYVGGTGLTGSCSHVVANNEAVVLYVSMSGSGNTSVYGARITYTVTNPLP